MVQSNVMALRAIGVIYRRRSGAAGGRRADTGRRALHVQTSDQARLRLAERFFVRLEVRVWRRFRRR
jgi:hypothetical protein